MCMARFPLPAGAGMFYKEALDRVTSTGANGRLQAKPISNSRPRFLATTGFSASFWQCGLTINKSIHSSPVSTAINERPGRFLIFGSVHRFTLQFNLPFEFSTAVVSNCFKEGDALPKSQTSTGTGPSVQTFTGINPTFCGKESPGITVGWNSLLTQHALCTHLNMLYDTQNQAYLLGPYVNMAAISARALEFAYLRCGTAL